MILAKNSGNRVDQVIAAWPQRQFQWGVTDCCAFCNFVLEQTVGYRYLPVYQSSAEAEQIIAEHGSLPNAVDAYLGFPRCDVEALTAGDVCYCEILGNEGIGIMMSDGRVAIVFEASGLRALSSDFIVYGWKIAWG